MKLSDSVSQFSRWDAYFWLPCEFAPLFQTCTLMRFSDSHPRKDDSVFCIEYWLSSLAASGESELRRCTSITRYALCPSLCALISFFQSYGRTDKTWLKCFVFLAWTLDTAHEGILLSSIYVYLVKDIGDLPALAISPL